MNKDYLKPEAEFVSLVAREEVTSDQENEIDILDGKLGIESSEF